MLSPDYAMRGDLILVHRTLNGKLETRDKLLFGEARVLATLESGKTALVRVLADSDSNATENCHTNSRFVAKARNDD